MTIKKTITPKESASSGASAEDQLRGNTNDIIAHFRAAMHQSGINYSGEIKPNGHVWSAYLDGSAPGIYCGIYRLSLTGTPSGYARDFSKPGIELRWKYTGKAKFPPVPEYIRQLYTRSAAEHRKRAAYYEVNYLWSISKPALSHPYLDRMGIKARGTRILNDDLVIPVRAYAGQPVSALQFISPDGRKKMLAGSMGSGHHFMIHGRRGQCAYICEDFASGASLSEKTEHPVAVAFRAENFHQVAVSLSHLPSTPRIIIASTNSRSGKSQRLAHEAATATRAQVYIPASVGTWHYHRDSIVGPSL